MCCGRAGGDGSGRLELAGGPSQPRRAVDRRVLRHLDGSGRRAGPAVLRGRAVAARRASSTSIVAVLPSGTCGLAEPARLPATWRAQRQVRAVRACSPVTSSPAVLRGRRRRQRRPDQGAGLATGRHGAQHMPPPDGTALMVGSALRVFRDEIGLHSRGRCSATSSAGVYRSRSSVMIRRAGSPSTRSQLRRPRPLRRTAARVGQARRLGLPVITDADVPARLRGEAAAVVRLCPRLALRLDRPRQRRRAVRPDAPGLRLWEERQKAR